MTHAGRKIIKKKKKKNSEEGRELEKRDAERGSHVV